MNEVYRIEDFRDDEEQQARAAADAMRDISREQKLNPEVKDLLGSSLAASDSGGLSLVSRPAEEPKLKTPERKPPKPRPRRREHAKRQNRKQVTRLRHEAQKSKQYFTRWKY